MSGEGRERGDGPGVADVDQLPHAFGPLPPDFAAEALYEPSSWFVHELLRVDGHARCIEARMDTTRLGTLVDDQRLVAGHDKHLPAAVAIQATGTLGQLYAVYALGLRPSLGWAGYGTHIHDARFPRMGRIGPPVHLFGEAERQRCIRATWFVTIAFRFEQEGEVVYRSRQSAAWVRPAG